jgi:CheY-like chemotaxis protein
MDGKRARILVVDDHPESLVILARLLSLYGYDVRTAESVGQATGLADGEPFDLLISDLGLPDGSGLDLMRDVGRRHGLRGIALTGFTGDADARESAEAGFEAHLAKPVVFPKLLEVVESLTGAASTRG